MDRRNGVGIHSTHGAHQPQHARDRSHAEAYTMLSKVSWAVVGDSVEAGSEASRIARCLRAIGKTVFAVDPNATQEVDEWGDPIAGSSAGAVCSLHDLPERVDVVLLALSPKAGRRYVDEMVQLGVKQLYIQAHVLWGLRAGWEALHTANAAGVRAHEANILTEISGGCAH